MHPVDPLLPVPVDGKKAPPELRAWLGLYGCTGGGNHGRTGAATCRGWLACGQYTGGAPAAVLHWETVFCGRYTGGAGGRWRAVALNCKGATCGRYTGG